jgi:hypothetical protein
MSDPSPSIVKGLAALPPACDRENTRIQISPGDSILGTRAYLTNGVSGVVG